MSNESLVEAVQSGDTRRSLVALRDFLANELEGARCSKCRASQLRTGDTAALALRLQKVIEDIEQLPPPREKGENDKEPVDELEAIRGRRGTKSGPRQQGGRSERHVAEE